MPDQIIIKDLEVAYRVGVPDQERSAPQRLLLTLEIERDFTVAAKNDDLAATVDYYAVAQKLLRFGEGRQWKLIESLAVEIAEMVLRDFAAVAVTVEVKKFVLPRAAHVAVRATRRR
ncbi:MAG TPA: dihydroneopterin aldolase [Verrucomicrobiae bacterium]|jgi:dihydroneopterin aldolase|nr:dihydroneopterin aldolase [Verrucomicrobiae bacterium]